MKKLYTLFFRFFPRSIGKTDLRFAFNLVSKQKTASWITLVLFFFLCSVGIAQPTISYPPSSVESLTRGMGSGKLAVNLGFTSTCNSINVEIRLPEGVQYVSGTVVSTGGTGGLTIQENGGSVNKPQFLISNAAAGNNIVFTIDRIANCGLGASGKDSVYVTSSCGNVSEVGAVVNTYNILAPSLSISPPTAIANANIGSSYSRDFSVTNGGNGCLDTLRIGIKRPSGSISSPVLKVGANVITPSSTNGDSTFYKVFTTDLPGGDNLMCNGETVTFTEEFTLLNCAGLTTTYLASWGRPGNSCQTASATGIVTMAGGVPNLTAAFSGPALTNCSALPYPATLTVTNSGTTPASNINVTLERGTTYFVNNVWVPYIDTTSLMVSAPSLTSYHPTNIHIDGLLTPGAGMPACAVGQVGWLDFNMPSGFLLQPGQSITITFNTLACSSGACGDNMEGGNYTTALSYKDQCGSNNYALPLGVALLYPMPNFKVNNINTQSPAQVASGSCFDVKIDASIVRSTYPTITNGYVEYAVTLPTGFTLGSASELSGLTPQPGYPMMVGNKAVFRHDVTAPLNEQSLHSVKFSLCTASGTCGVYAIDAEVSMTRDKACATPMISKKCFSAPVEVYCAPPCPTGGVIPVSWNYKRTTFGLPDNNNDGVPDVSGSIDLTKIDRDRYRPGDILHSEYRSYIADQSSPNTITNWNYVYSDWTFSSGKWAPSGTATVTIKRGPTTYSLTGVSISTVTAGTAFKADWSTNPALPGGFTYQQGDSVIVEADFQVDGNINNSGNGTEVQGPGYDNFTPGVIVLTNTAYASQIANPPVDSYSGPNRFTCFLPKYNANVVGLSHFTLFDGVNDAGATGCNNFDVTANVYTRVVNFYHGGRYFSYEYRPESMPDTVTIDIPVGWEYIATNFSRISATTQPTQYQNVTLSITPSVSSYLGGVRLVYDFKTLIANGTIPSWGTEGAMYTLSNRLRANCSTPASGEITVKENGHWVDYTSPTSQVHTTIVHKNTLRYSLASRPVLALQNNTGEVQGILPQHYWDVQVNSTGSSNAPYVWLALEQGASGISIDSVVLKPSNAVLTANSYAGTKKWYQVNATGIASGSNQQARIYFKYNSCSPDSIKVLTGWSCSGFPSPDPSASSCSEISTYLKVLPQPSQIQLSVTKQPTTPSIALCTTDNVEAVVNSALGANVDNPSVVINVPTGMTINLPIEVEYPLGSGVWQNITPSQSGNNYTVNLETHTGIGANGLPGTIINPGADGRQAKIRVSYNTSCSFISGSRIRFVTNGQSPCGSAAIGNGSYANSNPITITNATPDGTAALTMNIGNAQLTCDDSEDLTLSIIPVAEPTAVGDTAVYTLPSGLAYTGSFTAGTNCTGCTLTQVADPSGSTLLKVALPVGVATGTSINFTIGIKASGVGEGCGDRTILGELQRVAGGLSCGGTPCGAGKAIIGSGSQLVTILKPQLDAVSLNFTEAGSTVTYSVSVTNNGSADAVAGYQLKIYCGPVEDNNVLETITMGALTANSSQTYTGTFSSATCSLGTELYARVDTVFADNSPACSCSTPVASPSHPLPITLIGLKATKEGQTALLSWTTTSETNSHYFDVEQSLNGKNWEKIGNVPAKGTSNENVLYTFKDTNPENGENLYRLRMVDRDGKYGYSRMVSLRFKIEEVTQLYPSPVSDKLTIRTLDWNKVDDIVMYDTNGKVVYESHRGNSSKPLSQEINVKQFAAGVYLVHLSRKNGVATVHKVVVAR